MKLFELKDRPDQEKNFPRNIMPQIRKGNLQNSPFKFKKGKISLKKLKPVQNQRVKGMHDKAKQGFADGSIRPIIIDKDNYSVNGHHRYDVARGLELEKVRVLKVDASIEELIDYFTDTASPEPTYEEIMKAKLDSLMETIEASQDISALMKGIEADLKQREKDLKRLPKKSIYSEGDIVGMNPHAVKPYFSPEEADRANDEWVNQAQVDQEDGVIIKGTDGNQYRIMTSYGNQHFEDGEVYLDGVTDPEYLDTEGYPDAAELLYYHSATGHYPKDPEEIDERNLNPAVSDYVKGKKTKLVKVKVADLDDEAIDDRFGRVIDVDTDVGVDLDDPILLDKDGKTILDGFHRVYQAKRVGKEFIPAYMVIENLKAKLLQKINEIHSAKPYDNMDDNGLINFRYDDALGGDEKLASIPGISRNEVYDNGVSRHIFLMNNKEPIFLLTIKRGLDGWVTTNVVTHSDYRGKGFAVPVYLAVSKAYGEPLYSFGTQSTAGHKIWQNLAKQHPKRVTGYDVTTKQEVPFADVFDGKVATRAKLLPENFKDGKVKGKSRPGRVKRAGASCKGSVTSLRKKAKNSSGEKAKMYHWCANMKGGRKKS